MDVRKIAVYTLIVCVLLAGAALGTMQVIKYKISNYIGNIEPILSAKLGHIVKVGQVKVERRWLDLTIELDDFLIKDNNTAIPLFKTTKAIATINLWQTAISKSLKLAYLNFIEPQLVIRSDENNEYSVVGLRGEFVPGKIPIDVFLNMLSSKIELDITNGNFNSLAYPRIHGKFFFQQLAAGVKVTANKIAIALPNAVINLDLAMDYVHEEIESLELQAKSVDAPIATIYEYLPFSSFRPSLQNWFAMAFAAKRGTINSAVLTLKNKQIAAEINFANVDLKYAKNWPELVKLTGSVKVTTTKDNVVNMVITATDGGISGAAIDTATATITDLKGEHGLPILTVNTKLATSLTNGVDFLLHSPLREIGNELNKLQPKGSMQLGLVLDLELGKVAVVPKIVGDILVDKTLLVISETQNSDQLNISDFSGKFSFTEADFKAQDLKFMFHGNPGRGDGGLNKASNAIKLDFDVVVASQQLTNTWPMLKSFNLQGNTNAKVNVIIPKQQVASKQITISTDLVGVAMGLPAQFFKPKAAKQQLTVTVSDKFMTFSLDNLLRAKLLLQQGEIIGGQTITLDGRNIQGEIVLSTNNLPMEVRLRKLYLHTLGNDPTPGKTGNEKSAAKKLPMVVFNCDEFILDGNSIGMVRFNLSPKAHGYDIDNLSVENPNFNFQGRGNTQFLTNNNSQISGNLVSNNMGKLFAYWKLGDAMRGGYGDINLLLSWNDSIANFELSKASGNIKVNIRNGQLLGINPGLGRIIGLLSIENLQRRMQLNFSDVLGEGFAFDQLAADLNLEQGGVLRTTKELSIEGPSAHITMAGKAWIKTKDIDLDMNVMSRIGSTLPLAASIAAGNPAIGAVWWLAEQATGKAKNRDKNNIHYKYQVTGTWDKPKIQEIKGK